MITATTIFVYRETAAGYAAALQGVGISSASGAVCWRFSGAALFFVCRESEEFAGGHGDYSGWDSFISCHPAQVCGLGSLFRQVGTDEFLLDRCQRFFLLFFAAREFLFQTQRGRRQFHDFPCCDYALILCDSQSKWVPAVA